MRKTFHMLVPIFLLLLFGCQSDEEYASGMLSNEEGKLQIYFIFSDHSQQDNTSVYNEVMEHLYEHMDSNVSTVSMSSQTERIIKVYDIEEFPTFLVFDHESLLLQTTDPDEVKEFITEYYRTASSE